MSRWIAARCSWTPSYALAEGALAVHGTRNRDSVSWDYAGLLKLLGSLSRDRTGLPAAALLLVRHRGRRRPSRRARNAGRRPWPQASAQQGPAEPQGRRRGRDPQGPDVAGQEPRGQRRGHRERRGRPGAGHRGGSGPRDPSGPAAHRRRRWRLGHLAHRCAKSATTSSRSAPGHLRPYVDLISGAEPQLAASGVPGARRHRGTVTRPACRDRGARRPALRSPLTADYEHAVLAPAGPGAGAAAGSGSAGRRSTQVRLAATATMQPQLPGGSAACRTLGSRSVVQSGLGQQASQGQRK